MKEFLIEKTKLDSETLEKSLYLVFYALFVYHNISQVRWLDALQKNNWDMDQSEKEFFSIYNDFLDPIDLRLCLEDISENCWLLVNDLATDPYLNSVQIQARLENFYKEFEIIPFELLII